MMNAKIRILKDTPFNIAGDTLEIKDFRLKYNYICSNEASDQDLVHYIKNYASHPQLKQTSKYNTSEWFQVVDTIDLEPLEFIHEGILYSKQMDGFWHKFLVGNEIKSENSIGRILDVKKLIRESKYIKSIMYCTNNVNKKL